MSQNISSQPQQTMPQPQQMPQPMQARPQQMQGGPAQAGQPRPADHGLQQMMMGAMSQQQQRGNANQKKERPPAIYVAGLPNNYFNLELEKLFKAKGHKPIGAVVCIDHNTQKPKNYGFVSFATIQEAASAMESMNNYELNGRFLRISLQQADKQFDDQANLFVRSLAPEVTQQDFYNFFSEFGKIRSCKVETFQDGKSRCFGFVSFDSKDTANAVVEQYTANKDKFELQGKQFEVFHHQQKQERRAEGAGENKFTNLFVKNLPAGTDNDQLSTMFAEHGEIQSVHVQRDQSTQELKDSGFVCFKSPENAADALLAMNKKHLPDGSFLLVSQHISKRENELISNSKLPPPIQQNLTKNFDSNLFIKNLPADLTESNFKAAFEKFGPVVSVKFRTNPHVAQASYKQGFVLYENVDHAKLAIKNMDQTAVFGNRPISVDFWVSKQELENERFQKEQNEFLNWYRHSEDLRNKQDNENNMGMGNFGGQNPMQYQQQKQFQNRGYQHQRGGRQGNFRGGSNRGGYTGGRQGGAQPPRQGQPAPHQQHQQQPLVNAQNFPPTPGTQPAPQQPQQQPAPQVTQIRFPEVNIPELQAMPDRAERLKFVGNAIYFPIHDVHGDMAGKITGCLLDGVAEFERLVMDPDFLNQNVQQVYTLLVQQQLQAQAAAQQVPQQPEQPQAQAQPASEQPPAQ